MRRLVCACVVRKLPKTGFLASRPTSNQVVDSPWGPGHVAQLVTCLTADVSDCRSRVASSIRAGSHIFVEFDHEIINTGILLSSADSRWVVVSYKRKYVLEVLFSKCAV